MADINLIDVAKSMPKGKERSAVYTYADATHVTARMPMEMSGPVKSWKIVNDLPYTTTATATRSIYGEFTATKALEQPFNSNEKLYGGRVQYDRYLKRINPASTVASQQKSQVKGFAHQFTKDVFEGAGGVGIYGIQYMIDNIDIYKSQIRYAGDETGNASTGGTLTQNDLDVALSIHNKIPGSTYIYCTRTVDLRIKVMSRGAGGAAAFDSQALRYNMSEFGKWSHMYDDVPVVPLVDGKGDDLLSTTSSISNLYIVTYGEENFTGFNSKGPEVINMNGVSVTEAFDFEHTVGTAAMSKRCITMIKYVAESLS